MRRVATLFSLLVIIAGGLFLFWPHQRQNTGQGAGGGTSPAPQTQPETPPAQAENHDPRALTAAEQAAFLPQVCGGASGPMGSYAHQCTSLPGYPTQDYGGAGLGLGITLKSVVIGHLTGADADDAYVTYDGSFEPHASNFGGGMLFTGGPGKWKLKAWYPGGQATHCVSLNATGRAKFVCLQGWAGQGEADSTLTVETLPPPSGEKPAILSAGDLRGTLDPNRNCENRSGGQAILLSIDHLHPAAGGAKADITYVPADEARRACAAHHFADAKTKTASLTLHWNGSAMKISPDLNFAAAP